MSWDEEGQPRRRVADWALLAQQRLALLQAERLAEGLPAPIPVLEKSRKLAQNAWGAAWMRQLAYCEQEGFYLARGRTLLRHGCVLDLQLSRGRLQALVSGEELYTLDLHLDEPEAELLDALRQSCSGQIDSYISLLEGKVDAAVMAQLCEPEQGLLPLPHEWHMDCDCPDWNEPCEHAAAVIYAAGCLIDRDASLLFTLRGISPESFCQSPPVQPEDFDLDALAAKFEIDFDDE